MPPSHVLVLGASLAADFARARPTVRTSVIRRRSAVAAPSGPFTRERFVERGSGPVEWLDAAREIHRDRSVHHVVAFGENEQLMAALVADELGLRGHHGVDVARAVADKIEMRRRLAAGGLDTVDFAEVPDAAAIERFVRARPAGRCLVKPAMGTGSRGVSEVVDLRDCPALFERARDVAHPVAGAPRVMVEEFKPGRQLSVESMSENGQHRVVAITQKYTDGRTFAEVGHCVPADLSGPEIDAVTTCTTIALDALGIRYGPTHTEVVLARSGRVDVIETHTRLGGHGIPGLVAAAVGTDLQELTFAQAAGESVLPRLPEALPRAGSARAVWFGYAPVAGRVRSIRSGPWPDVDVEVLVGPGSVVTSDMTRSGRVLAARSSGITEADAAKKAAQAVAEATVVIECAMTAQLLSY